MTRLTAFIATIALSLPSVAIAQDSATVDAVATFEEAPASVTVSAGNNLQFGTLQYPGGDESLSCLFTVWADGSTAVETTSNNPITEVCRFAGSPSAATFSLECSAGTSLILSASALSATGYFLRIPDDSTGVKSVIQHIYAGGVENSSSSASLSEVCPPWGTIDLNVAGEFFNVSPLEPGTNVTVGTITLTATL